MEVATNRPEPVLPNGHPPGAVDIPAGDLPVEIPPGVVGDQVQNADGHRPVLQPGDRPNADGTSRELARSSEGLHGATAAPRVSGRAPGRKPVAGGPCRP